jgi:hypothetical protein
VTPTSATAIYAKQHQDEFAAYAVKQTGIDPKVEAKSLERGDPIWDNQLGVDLEALRDTQRFQRDLGYQNTLYEPKDLVDTSGRAAAARARCRKS